MKLRILILFISLSVLMSSSPLLAHHNFRAEFDINMPIIVTGTITRVALTNPHARLYIDAIDENNKIIHWDFELASASALLRRGWKRDTFEVGDEVIVHAARARNAPYVGNVEYITILNTDGSEGFTFGSPRE